MAAAKKKKPTKKIVKTQVPQPTEETIGVVSTETVSVVETSMPPLDQQSKEVNQDSKEIKEEDAIPRNYDVDDNFSWKKILTWTVGIFLFIALIAGVLFVTYNQGVKVGEERIRAQIALSPTPPEATPTPETKEKSTFKIKVLNGSGIGGEASAVKTLLEAEGYEISDIGNADSSYETTVIQAKDGVDEGWLNMLTVFLQDTYEMGDAETLDDNEDVDVIVVVGSSKTSD